MAGVDGRRVKARCVVSLAGRCDGRRAAGDGGTRRGLGCRGAGTAARAPPRGHRCARGAAAAAAAGARQRGGCRQGRLVRGGPAHPPRGARRGRRRRAVRRRRAPRPVRLGRGPPLPPREPAQAERARGPQQEVLASWRVHAQAPQHRGLLQGARGADRLAIAGLDRHGPRDDEDRAHGRHDARRRTAGDVRHLELRRDDLVRTGMDLRRRRRRSSRRRTTIPPRPRTARWRSTARYAT